MRSTKVSSRLSHAATGIGLIHKRFAFAFANPLRPSKLHRYELLIKKHCPHCQEVLDRIDSNGLRDIITTRDVDIKPLTFNELLSLRYKLKLPVQMWIHGTQGDIRKIPTNVVASEGPKSDVRKIIQTISDDNWKNFELLLPIIYNTSTGNSSFTTDPNQAQKQGSQNEKLHATVCRPAHRIQEVIRMDEREIDDSHINIGEQENYRTRPFSSNNSDDFKDEYDPMKREYNTWSQDSYHKRHSPQYFHSTNMDSRDWHKGSSKNASKWYDQDQGMSWNHVDYKNYRQKNETYTSVMDRLDDDFEYDHEFASRDNSGVIGHDPFGTPLSKEDLWRLGPKKRR